jgi:hypothetical protein
MELETVKIISRNDDIRGKSFDVYYFIEANEIKLCAVEDIANATDIKELLSPSSIADIKFSLKEVLTMRELKNLDSSNFNDGFIKTADENRVRGYSND